MNRTIELIELVGNDERTQSEFVSVGVERELYERLATIREQRGVSVRALVNCLIADGLDAMDAIASQPTQESAGSQDIKENE